MVAGHNDLPGDKDPEAPSPLAGLAHDLRGSKTPWVPAVLRYTAAGNAVLVEVCNLGNAEDRELILKHEWRENYARAVVEGLAAAYDE